MIESFNMIKKTKKIHLPNINIVDIFKRFKN